MRIETLLKCVFLPVAIGMVLGVGIGAVVGALSPQFIALMLKGTANPVTDGVALGLINGAIYGFFAGLAILIVFAILNRPPKETKE